MAVLAAALLPLLALQGQFLRTTESMERAETRLAVQDMALAHIQALNLDQSPTGQFSTLYGEIRWASKPAAGPTMARGADGFPSRYVITLYDVNITVDPTSQQQGLTLGQSLQFKLQGLGWHPTKALLETL